MSCLLISSLIKAIENEQSRIFDKNQKDNIIPDDEPAIFNFEKNIWQ